ncbi:hypothetical protein BB558_002880 [Smittium angustum]|uniref:Uncharacterized protein n=1 Tax=Smittium angustum TaxID=133377 RepID=A0A2U1J7W8_SMIAN|nr:hypothetical protein BB558_002880 [Smittium angustum]
MFSKTIVYSALSTLLFGSQVYGSIYPTNDIKLSENELKFVKTGIDVICDNKKCNLEYILGRGDHCAKLILQSKDCYSKEMNLQNMKNLAESFKDVQTEWKPYKRLYSCKTYATLKKESCYKGNSLSVEFNKNKYYI